jgi:hypothetical protein
MMPDRLQLPDDRSHPCRGCGAEEHVSLADCEDCGASICSVCRIEESAETDLCRRCATKRLNEELAAFVPVCICSELPQSANVPWPDSVRYGQQLQLSEGD